MSRYQVKLVISAAVVALMSEIVKRYPLAQGLVVSVPFVSLLAIIWLHASAEEPQRETGFAETIFWLALPSLCFFLFLNLLQHSGYGFYGAYAFAATMMVGLYAGVFQFLRLLRVRI